MRGKPLTKQVAVENLELNKPYRDYRALCEILGESTRTGSSKNAQLKNWARYFLYEKEGREYTIREIYSEPLTVKRKKRVTLNEKEEGADNNTENKIEDKIKTKEPEKKQKEKRKYTKRKVEENIKVNKTSDKMESDSKITEKNKETIFTSVLSPETVKHMLIQQEISLFTNQYNVAKNQMSMAKEQIQGLKGQLKQVKGRGNSRKKM